MTPGASAAAALGPPPLRDGTIPRPALAERLRGGAHVPVAAVVAPAGYGKTSLLVDAARGGDLPLAWLTIRDAKGAELDRLARVSRTKASLRVVVDDLHLLDPSRWGAVEQVAARLPANSQLLLASRTPLPAAVPTLGPDDLRMTPLEASALLRGAGAPAPDSVVAGLNERLEGWPAGLYLAALAHEADGEPLSEFTGADRYVCEYLRDECLASLDGAGVRFLLHASALDRLSGPLCNHALRTTRSADRLENLARTLLFVRPAGDGYRLHRAFRDALRAELDRHEPGRAEAIARRAGDWHERHGEREQAVPYAWAAGRRDRFAELVERSAPALYNSGRIDVLERWLGWPDEQQLADHPMLAAWSSLLHALRGRADDALHLVELAAQARGPHSAGLALVRAAMCAGGPEQMAADASLALDTPLRPAALLLLGVAVLLEGDGNGADEILARIGSEPADASCLALAERAGVAAAAGRWDDAQTLVEQARRAIGDAGLGGYPTSAMTFATGARVAVERSDWVRARADIAHARGLLPMLTGAIPWLATQVRLELAAAHAGLSERGAAAALLDETVLILDGRQGLDTLRRRADELRGEIAHGTGGGRVDGNLTPAELRLLPLLTTHLSFREIADELGVSRNTVKTQAICIYRKLGVTSRSASIDRANELGLLTRPVARV